MSPLSPSMVAADCHGRCCRGYDYVEMRAADQDRLARHLGMSQADFESHYRVLRLGRARYLPTKHGCPFLRDDRCAVYEARPRCCRDLECGSLACQRLSRPLVEVVR